MVGIVKETFYLTFDPSPLGFSFLKLMYERSDLMIRQLVFYRIRLFEIGRIFLIRIIHFETQSLPV